MRVEYVVKSLRQLESWIFAFPRCVVSSSNQFITWEGEAPAEPMRRLAHVHKAFRVISRLGASPGSLRRAAEWSIPTRSVSNGQFRRSLTYVSGYDW